MLERIKKAFAKQTMAELPSAPDANPVSAWASMRGLSLQQHGQDKGVSIDGSVQGKPWRVEIGKPSRNFIHNEELRARAVLGINEDIGLLIMNRPLKRELEKQAYARYTDNLQTRVDTSLPEELRWLSMYDEVGWDSLPGEFWSRYSLLADQRANAQAWLDVSLAKLLLGWPEPSPSAQTPFILMLLRGNAYLRMQYEPADLPTLTHATGLFTSACESALEAFGS